jgi:hypothetical protein
LFSFISLHRAQLFDSPNSSLFELVISPLKATDEGVYKCDITYLEVKDECAVVQFVNLTTLGKKFPLYIIFLYERFQQ